MNKVAILSALACSSLILSACGSSSNSSDHPPTISGTAATGAAIVDGIVSAKCAKHTYKAESVTDSHGHWSIQLKNKDDLPCALQVSFGDPTQKLHSYADSLGNTNITPLTDLSLAYALGKKPAAWFDSFDGTKPITNLKDKTSELLDSLKTEGFNVPSSGDIFNTPLVTNGKDWNGLLDDLKEAAPDHQSLVTSLASAGSTPLTDLLPSLIEKPDTSGGNNHETPANDLTLLASYAGIYTVACTAIKPTEIGPASHDHQRGTITIETDGTIDYDTDILFSANQINQLYDKTYIDNDAQRRIHINYDADDSGRGINIYLDNNLSVAEIYYRDGEGTAIRAAIDETRCDQNDSEDDQNSDNTDNPGNTDNSNGYLIDLTQINLTPTMPTDLTPIAPNVNPIDPADKLANLFAQLGEAEKTAITTTPENIQTQIGNSLAGNGHYGIVQTTADSAWRREIFFNLGEDNIPNTDDDEIAYYILYPYGQNSVAYRFSSAGADGEWFTEDDVLDTDIMLGNSVYFREGALLEFSSASEGAVLIIPCLDGGEDSILFTEDDVVGCTAGYQVAIVDGEGNRAQVVNYYGTSSQIGAGADGKWFTEDDIVHSYTLIAFDGDAAVNTVVYDGKGPDGTWFTEDDTITSYTLTQLDANYKPEYSVTYSHFGPDQEWFSADDKISSITFYALDDKGDAALTATYINKGSDGEWLTEDDDVSATFNIVQTLDDGGRAEVFGTIGNTGSPGAGAQGADGVWLTADDQITRYDYLRFDAAGQLITQIAFDGKGG